MSDELKHYGIKGMEWGKKKKSKRVDLEKLRKSISDKAEDYLNDRNIDGDRLLKTVGLKDKNILDKLEDKFKKKNTVRNKISDYFDDKKVTYKGEEIDMDKLLKTVGIKDKNVLDKLEDKGEDLLKKLGLKEKSTIERISDKAKDKASDVLKKAGLKEKSTIEKLGDKSEDLLKKLGLKEKSTTERLSDKVKDKTNDVLKKTGLKEKSFLEKVKDKAFGTGEVTTKSLLDGTLKPGDIKSKDLYKALDASKAQARAKKRKYPGRENDSEFHAQRALDEYRNKKYMERGKFSKVVDMSEKAIDKRRFKAVMDAKWKKQKSEERKEKFDRAKKDIKEVTTKIGDTASDVGKSISKTASNIGDSTADLSKSVSKSVAKTAKVVSKSLDKFSKSTVKDVKNISKSVSKETKSIINKITKVNYKKPVKKVSKKAVSIGKSVWKKVKFW
jgi:hypothetical protein